MQRCALFRSRRELSNAYLFAKFGFDTAENEPCKVCDVAASRVRPAEVPFDQGDLPFFADRVDPRLLRIPALLALVPSMTAIRTAFLTASVDGYFRKISKNESALTNRSELSLAGVDNRWVFLECVEIVILLLGTIQSQLWIR